MAEAYFNSLNLVDKHAISSGSVADLHSNSNKYNFEITQSVLVEHGLGDYTKTHWDQLTQEKIDSSDKIICLSQSVKAECDKLFVMPENTVVWDIPDFDEVTPIPLTEAELHDYAEKTFQTIVNHVRQFVTADSKR